MNQAEHNLRAIGCSSEAIQHWRPREQDDLVWLLASAYASLYAWEDYDIDFNRLDISESFFYQPPNVINGGSFHRGDNIEALGAWLKFARERKTALAHRLLGDLLSIVTTDETAALRGVLDATVYRTLPQMLLTMRGGR